MSFVEEVVGEDWNAKDTDDGWIFRDLVLVCSCGRFRSHFWWMPFGSSWGSVFGSLLGTKTGSRMSETRQCVSLVRLLILVLKTEPKSEPGNDP